MKKVILQAATCSTAAVEEHDVYPILDAEVDRHIHIEKGATTEGERRVASQYIEAIEAIDSDQSTSLTTPRAWEASAARDV